jgi:hypothetical protein
MAKYLIVIECLDRELSLVLLQRNSARALYDNSENKEHSLVLAKKLNSLESQIDQFRGALKILRFIDGLDDFT